MPRPLIDYWLTMGLCLAAYAGYRYALAPWIDPPPPSAAPIDRKSIDEEVDPRLESWFPAGAWQRDRPKRLQTEAGLLLFREWQQGEGRALRLSPVSIVVAHEGADPTDSAPIIIDAPQGAVIQLADAIDLAAGGAPPISGGHFLGPVHIYSLPPPASQGSPSSPRMLDLQTSNIRIDRHRIWTADPVVLNYDELVVRGRDLTMQLYPRGAHPAGRTGPLAALERIELIYLDQLRMHLPQGGLWEPLPGRQRAATAADPTQTAFVEATCQGPVSINFAALAVTLQQRVELRHQLPGELSDTLRCDRLDLTLSDQLLNSMESADGPPAQNPSSTPGAPAQRPLHHFLAGLEARGNPVAFVAPTLLAEGRTTRVQVDFRAGEARMLGVAGVTVQQGPWKLVAPTVRYRFDPAQPTALGALTLAGPGRVENGDPQAALRQVRWADPIHLVPDQNGHRIDLVGGVAGDLADGGHLRADEAHAWLVPAPPSAHPAAVQSPESAQGGLVGNGLYLDRILASGRVEIADRRVDLQVEEVQLWFAPPRTAVRDGSVVEPIARQTLPRSAPSLLAGSDARPPNTVAGVTNEPSTPLVPASTPTRIRGQKLAARLASDPQGYVVQDLSLSGPLEIEHRSASSPSTPDAFGQLSPDTRTTKLRGDGLRWVNDPAAGLLQIHGQPARLEMNDGYLLGQVIHVDTTQNLLWIDQAGSCQLPSPVERAPLPADGSADRPLSAMRWVAPPIIVWQQGLTFDGQQLTVDGQVEFNGRIESIDRPGHWHLAGRADRLQLQLDQRMIFSSPQAMRPQLQQVRAEGSVIAAGTQFGPTGQQQAYHLLRVGQLDYYPLSGAIDSPGAGDYRLWTLSMNVRQAQTPSGLSAMHLAYNERLEGNAPQGWLQALGGVRVGYSPVDTWEQAVEVDQLEQLSEGQLRLDCQRLRVQRPPHAMPSRGGPAWELLAAGDVRCAGTSRSGRFQATAAEAHYATEKELLTILGDGRRPAILESPGAAGRPGGQLQADLIRVNPETLEMDFQLRGARTEDLSRRGP